MKRLSTEYDGVLNRLRALSNDHTAKWGTMNASQMLSHLCDQMRVAMGQAPCNHMGNIFMHTIVKWLTLYILPIPKGKIKTVPEMQTTSHESWEDSSNDFKSTLEMYKNKSTMDQWSPHPAFGKMSGNQWDILTYKHINHHFSQFGI